MYKKYLSYQLKHWCVNIINNFTRIKLKEIYVHGLDAAINRAIILALQLKLTSNKYFEPIIIDLTDAVSCLLGTTTWFNQCSSGNMQGI